MNSKCVLHAALPYEKVMTQEQKKNCICKQQSSLQNTHQLNQRELRRIWEHNSIALGTEITSSTSEKGELKKYKLQQENRLANVQSVRQVASKIKITIKSN